MKIIENLQITKFFDVKTPVGINQRNESLSNYSIGIDLYMPKFTPKFFDAIIEANKKIYPEIKWYAEDGTINFINGDDLLVQINLEKDFITGKFTSDGTFKIMTSQLQIPSGIGMNIPDWVWCEVRTKSSNFQNNWTEVHGTVDMNYTYGVGVQMLLIDTVQLKSNQKFAQLVFHEAVPVLEITEVQQSEWNKNPDIISKRGIRTGGFGSTGKFDNTTKTNK